MQYEQFDPELQLASLVTPSEQASSANVVLLHGWLDNARSFDGLAAKAQRQGHGADWVAVDMPGHGRSAWSSSANDYMAWGYIAPLARFVEKMTNPVDLVCHSMGTNTGILLAASRLLPIRSLTLLDGIGPFTDSEHTFASQLKKGMAEQLNSSSHVVGRSQATRRFANVADAIERRQQFSRYLTCADLDPMMRRNLVKANGGYAWGTDPRLRLPSVVRFSEQHIRSYCHVIDIPVLVIQAQHSMIPNDLFTQRLAYFSHVQHQEVDGHHHCHMVGDTLDTVFQHISTFHKSL